MTASFPTITLSMDLPFSELKSAGIFVSLRASYMVLIKSEDNCIYVFDSLPRNCLGMHDVNGTAIVTNI